MSQSHTKDQPKASDVDPNKEQRPSMCSMFDASISSVQTEEYDASTSTWGDADYDMSWTSATDAGQAGSGTGTSQGGVRRNSVAMKGLGALLADFDDSDFDDSDDLQRQNVLRVEPSPGGPRLPQWKKRLRHLMSMDHEHYMQHMERLVQPMGSA